MTNYQRYQLEWMLDHNYSLEDLLNGLQEAQANADEEGAVPIRDLFGEWEFNHGFDGAIWVCEDEWNDSEAQEDACARIISAVEEGLERGYSPNNIDVVEDEDEDCVCVMYHDRHNSFPLSPCIVIDSDFDYDELVAKLDKMRIGHQGF